MRNLVFAVVLVGACGGSSSDATFVAYGSSTSSITLAWQPVEGAIEYAVERSASGGAFEPLVTLPPTNPQAESYLDEDIAPGKYTYRLTAIGTEDSPRESSTETTDDVALRTTDDPALGAPVVQIMGSAGGTIELPQARATIPPGALPDGTTVTLTPLAPPTGAPEFDAAVEIAADVPFTMPVTITFTRPEGEPAENITVAVKRTNGTWVEAPSSVDATGVSLVLSESLTTRGARHAQPPYNHARVLMVRKLILWPPFTFVKKSSFTVVHAELRFSDEPCAGDGAPWACRIANRSVFMFPNPVVVDRPIRNSSGEWINHGPGTLFVNPSESSIIHKAPPTAPDDRSWRVSFKYTYKNAPYEGSAIFNFNECLARDFRSAKAPEDVCTGNWSGTSTAPFPMDAGALVRFDANVVWTYDIQNSTAENSEFYPVGTVTLTSLDPCLTYAPSVFQFGKADEDGNLSIDHTVDPPTFYGAGASHWNLTATNSCTDPPSSTTTIFGGGWFAGSGELTNPALMAGTVSLGGTTYTYNFVKDP